MTGPKPYHAITEPWVLEALCTQFPPDMWHPEPKDSATGQAAKNICHQCDVRDECLTYALDNNEQEGIWGGLVLKERRALKRLQESR